MRRLTLGTYVRRGVMQAPQQPEEDPSGGFDKGSGSSSVECHSREAC